MALEYFWRLFVSSSKMGMRFCSSSLKAVPFWFARQSWGNTMLKSYEVIPLVKCGITAPPILAVTVRGKTNHNWRCTE